MARNPKPKDDDDKQPDPEPTPPPQEDPDKEIRRGGPGDAPVEEKEPEPASDPAQSRSRVKIGRREFEVAPDMAAAIEERERDYMRGISLDRRDREELDRYRRAAQPAQPANTEPDWNTLLFENPSKALALRDNALEARLEAKYRTEQATERMWRKFFDDHPDLADERMLVQARFQADFDEIADMPTAKAMDVLADNVRKDILRISRKSRGTGTVTSLPTNRATVEGATGDRSAPPPRAKDDDEPTSLSAEIRRRAAQRRAHKSA